MKRILTLTIILIFILTIAAGCSKKETVNNLERSTVGSVVKTDKKPPQGIAYNKIKFETVKESDVPKEISDSIEKLKKSTGFIYTEDKDSGYIYVVVFIGEKPTGGYSVTVMDVSDSEGRTEVVIEEKMPQKGAIVTEALTYPFTIVKAKGITTNISVKNTGGEVYKKL